MQNKTNFIYLLSIYIISTAISFLWLGFTDMSYLQSTDGYVIITPDGYHYLKTIDNIIKDAPIVESSVFCYLFAIPLKLLGTENAKDILFFIPPFFAGTFGVGAYLFSREFLQNKYAFLASLLAASNIGAITRLKVGYFDTDIFVFTLPIFIIAFGLRYLRNGKQGELVAAITFAILLSIVYSNGSILLLFSVIGFGVLFLIDRKNQSAKKLTLWLLLASLANPDYILGIFSKAELYLTKSENIADLAYNSTFGFIAESSTVSYVQTMKLISSDPILFALSIIGLLLLVRQKREIIVMFPFLFLGLAAFVLGSRFAPFAAVAVNVGLIYFGVHTASMLQKKYLRYSLFALLFIPGFTVNILNAALNDEIGGFHAKEISSLAKIKPLVEKNSTVFSRWDYGYELRYYLEAFTPSNNGGMGGAQIFVESAALSSTNQNFAANLILEAEAQLRQPVPKDDKNSSTLLVKMAGQKGFDTAYISGYLNYLEQNRSNPCKNTYLLIPTRMTDIFETIQKNANAEFMKGRINPAPFFKFYRVVAENNDIIKLHTNTYIDKNSKIVSIDNNKTNLSAIYIVNKNNSKTDVFTNKLNAKDGMVLIFLQELNGYILSDKRSIETTFVQMLLFDNYDKTRFEKIYDDQYFKLFRAL